jgi:hypothetical protein
MILRVWRHPDGTVEFAVSRISGGDVEPAIARINPDKTWQCDCGARGTGSCQETSWTPASRDALGTPAWVPPPCEHIAQAFIFHRQGEGKKAQLIKEVNHRAESRKPQEPEIVLRPKRKITLE